MKFIFTKTAEKQFLKLDQEVQTHLKAKIFEYKTKPELFKQNFIATKNLEPATHRLKVGNYRLLLESDIDEQTHRVLKVGHRKSIYQ